jgi:hypothetical protein
MCAFKHPFNARSHNAVSGLCLAVLTLLMVLCPLKKVLAEIDQTMPSNIPSEVVSDWKAQSATMESIKAKLIEEGYEEFANKIEGSGDAGFLSAHHWNRVAHMSRFEEDLETIMFARHHNLGGFLMGYDNNVDGSCTDNGFQAAGALCLLKFENYYSQYEEILSKKDKVVRDPCISLDGKKVCFAMSGGGKGTGYNLYEMEIENPSNVTQLTENPAGLVTADFEPCYLPNGDIMFNSTRNYGMLDCATNPTTNMFLMRGDGKFIHQIGFDQVHTFYPTLMDDGSVLYTRWEYNDRDVRNSFGYMVMNPDGCRQMEYFGQQTEWPMSMLHGRQVPNTPKIMGIASGHHSVYAGELFIADPTLGDVDKGFNGANCITMLAPQREAKPVVHTSGTMQGGDVQFLFQNPYPLSSKYFLISYRTSENGKYRIYFMDVDGNRELLAWNNQSLSQPVLVKPRDVPRIAEQANYVKENGEYKPGGYTMQDVYYGLGMTGVEKSSGVAKTLRVVKLRYRVQGMGMSGGSQMGQGPSGVFTPAVMCPVSLYGGAWEAKEVLGETPIFEDGSAAFQVPSRTPVFFQVLDEKGMCIANMRSWSTLMPGEILACVGCHENRNLAPPDGGIPMAGTTPQPLETPLGIENQPFDYGEIVAPILNQHCGSKCHGSGHQSGFDLRDGMSGSWTRSYSSLMSGISRSGQNKAINIVTMFSSPPQKPPYTYGSTKSGMMDNIWGGHKDVNLTETEKKIVACWIDLAGVHSGTYDKYMSANAKSTWDRQSKNLEKWKEIEEKNLQELAEVQVATRQKKNGTVKLTSLIKDNIRFVPTLRTLVLKEASEGTLRLMDLRGRVIFSKKLSDKHAEGNATISLPSSLSTGLYLAKFEGVHGVQQAKLTITQ